MANTHSTTGRNVTSAIVDEHAPIDWSKITVSNSLLGGDLWANAKSLNVQADQYLAQTFEDRPTIFGEEPRVTVRMSALELMSSKLDAGERKLAQAVETLQAFVARECPSCKDCLERQMLKQERRLLERDEIEISVIARCNRYNEKAFSIQCPDGQHAVRRGKTALVAKPLAEGLPRPVRTLQDTNLPFKPYISHERDKPTTASTDAW